MDESLLPLLDHLNTNPITAPQPWREWRITPISGGANNLIYRVTRAGEDYAVKFTVRDDRNRAGREFAALSALQQAGLELAPQPVFLDLDRFRQPVVVQTWLNGETLTQPPETDDDWVALLQHFCAIHTLTPAHTKIELQRATINSRSGAEGKRMVYQHLEKLPPEARPASLMALLARFDAWTPPLWEAQLLSLCRVDPNWRNFIRLSHIEQGTTHLAQRNNPALNFDGSTVTPKCVAPIVSVDWENSGWGDPAFEIADLMTHPAYETVSPTRWEWLIEAYAEQRKDLTANVRIRTYYTVMLMWWVIRWARYLYEVPRGLDQRLVQRPENWQAETEQKAVRFTTRVEEHWNSLG